MALEYLRDQLAQEKPAILDRLGWTKEDARKFLERWEEMKRDAAQKGATEETAQKQYRAALKSLGLRPRGTELGPSGASRDQLRDLHDAGRFPPPPEWAEPMREYLHGIASPERPNNRP